VRNNFTLSGGEKQTVAIASSCALAPSVLVFDEPSANLDLHAITRLRIALEALKNAGKTVVIAEHRLHYLKGLADRVVLMKAGRIAEVFDAGAFWAMGRERRIAYGIRAFDLEPIPQRPVQAAPRKEILDVRNLSIGYRKGQPLLSDLSFRACGGEVVGIIGKNGQGKTTLARALCGLMKESAGEIRVAGKKETVSARRRKFYLVMQESNYQHFTESVESELRLSDSKKRHYSDAQVDSVLDSLDLTALRGRHPLQVSGGEKQRVAIAVGLMQGAPVVILDEPTSGLDYRNMLRVRDCVERMREAGRLVFIISHDLELLTSVCTRILQVDSGRIRDDYSLDEDGFERLRDFLDREES
jgi:energy-coupling factor transport system ATP-binding protein